MLGNINTSSALGAFEKMEEKGTDMLKKQKHNHINIPILFNWIVFDVKGN